MKKMYRNIKYIKSFGIKLTLLKMIHLTFSYAKKKTKFRKWLFDKYKSEVLIFLRKNILSEINLTEIKRTSGDTKTSVKYIWTFWWQGMENTPDSVRMCIKNMRKYAGNCKVVVVDKYNIKKYIKMQPNIEDKLERGEISYTHLSDIVRMQLLNNYGGLWLDAGIFPLKIIDNTILENSYYTRKVESHQEANVSDSKWCGSITMGKKGNIFFKFMVDAFNVYWEKYDVLIDYFLIDYFTELAYENIYEYRNSVDILPYNNRDLYDLEKKLNDEYEEKSLNYYTSNNYFGRLQWRKTYLRESINGKETMYAKIFEFKD